MRLALTSTAAPGVDLVALDAACRGRGLDGVELVVSEGESAEELAFRAAESGARVVALRAEALDERSAPDLASASGRLNVPVSVPIGAVPRAGLARLAGVFAEASGRLLVAHPTSLEAAMAALDAVRAAGAPQALGLAWDIRPSEETLVDAGAIVFATREKLGLARLYGGGPEQRDQDGLGIGPLLVALALSGYEAPLVLSPSRKEQLPRWEAWLSSKKITGCGSRVDPKTIVVDVRDVEPKDRLDTILGAYRELLPGSTLRLTVDHDPSCMYHTLQATEPEGSFRFETTEHGPEVWRAVVMRL